MTDVKVSMSRLSLTGPSILPVQVLRWLRIVGLLIVLLATEGGLFVPVTETIRAEAWSCWRGPRGDGTCIEKKHSH